ncbi:MAG: phosphate ABC transporter substrate-binding protein [Sedimentisphaerales bacterium]|nr:phosphate ABC transporter substrate-binding protein [Sedimentisphaerales bacterium]
MRRIIYGLTTIMLLVSSSVSAETLQLDGSTTVGPIAVAFAEYFKSIYPDLQITVKQTGSGDGAAALVDGRCGIANMSRFMKPKEFSKAVEKGVFPVAHVVAMDGVCIIVHPSNPVRKLTKAQVRDIYTGRMANWRQVGGADMPIVVVSRDTSSGTYETFHNIVMENKEMSQHVEYVNANPQAHARVRTTRGAIGYVGLGFVDNNVRALEIDGIMPSRKTIATGVYPVTRPLYMFTNGYPELGSMIHKFCTFYLTERGQELVEEKGFVPLTNY